MRIGGKVPWYVTCLAMAAFGMNVGLYWDISWHMSIGRDTFWIPPHMCAVFSVMLGLLTCGFLILANTFHHTSPLTTPEGSASPDPLWGGVRIWGFRGPLGAFIVSWGGLLMLSDSFFDNWWHTAYGLDVTMLTPPHTLLVTGLLAIQLGALVLIAAKIHHILGRAREKLNAIFLFVCAMVLTLEQLQAVDLTTRLLMHHVQFYIAVSVGVPVLLVGVSQATGHRWASSLVATIYTLVGATLLWILALFPAEPKIGPVYHPVTHFIPLGFPLLLVVPALVRDLGRIKWPSLSTWKARWQAVLEGSLFLVVFMAVQWPFGSFLMSPHSRNWVFGTNYFPYGFHATDWMIYLKMKTPNVQFMWGLTEAWIAAILSARLGLAWGNWIQQVRR